MPSTAHTPQSRFRLAAFGEVLRTPDERFAALPGWTYQPRYIDDLPGREGLRLHYIDEGPPDAAVTVLALHGQPSWSYLNRKMIPVYVAAGCRVVAFDWFGFGRSDKPVSDAVYTFNFHRDTLLAFVERMDLLNVCLQVQDWGGLLGLTLPMAQPERVTRLVVMNTAIADGSPPSDGFLAWKAYAATQPDLDCGKLIRRGTPVLSEAEAAAYNAPYPDAAYKGGVRRFPEIVPVSPDMEGADIGVAARRFLSTEWTGESFMAVGEADPVLGLAVMAGLRSIIRGCPEPMLIPEGGHFVQEWGEPIARAALAHFKLA
ncbi:alpha/beta fold hydrolase [bacterium]|nr:alpha/beta fold hydrolase [bacterium]